jgi:hypothetical protein
MLCREIIAVFPRSIHKIWACRMFEFLKLIVRWLAHVTRMGRGEVYRGVCVGKHEGKRPLG